MPGLAQFERRIVAKEKLVPTRASRRLSEVDITSDQAVLDAFIDVFDARMVEDDAVGDFA